MKSIWSFAIRIAFGLCFLACFLTESAVIKGRSDKQLTPRIIGGQEAVRHSFPWQASLQLSFEVRGRYLRYPYCGGVLFSREWVLTTAHCITGVTEFLMTTPNSSIVVILGAHDLTNVTNEGQVFDVDPPHVHRAWNLSAVSNDIALLKLRSPLQDFTKAISNISLPVQDSGFKPEADCYLTGWGRTKPYGGSSAAHLQVLPGDLLNTSQCLQRIRLLYGRENVSFEAEFEQERQKIIQHEKEKLCVQGIGGTACLGDSGGPLSCRENGQWILRGLASYIIAEQVTKNSKACYSDMPAIYTRVSNYVDWINSWTMNH